MKKSGFNNLVRRGDCLLVHNPLHNTMIKIYEPALMELMDVIQASEGPLQLAPEVQESEFYEDIRKLNMIVENDMDEISLLNYKYDLTTGHALTVHIIPTMQCNFRCPYCYEEHVDKTMTRELYDNTIHAIAGLVEAKDYKAVLISWFGGEPTLEMDNVIRFMQQLREAVPDDVVVRSHMTTNAYLLTPERFTKLVENNVKGYQITVDGLQETHDKTRFLAGGQGSWERIISNLKGFKEVAGDFSIMVRTNVTVEIRENIDSWMKFLADNFADDERFHFYFETVKDFGSEDKSYHYDLSKEADPMQEILESAAGYGLDLSFFKSKINTFSFICYAASPDTMLIDWDGSVKKCTLVLEDGRNQVGCVSQEGQLDIESHKFAAWTHYDALDICKKCSIYPVCYSKKCPASYYSKASCTMLQNVYNATLMNAF